MVPLRVALEKANYYASQALGANVTSDARFGAVLAAHGNSETAIALDFAQRLRELVERLYRATEMLFA